MVKNIEKRNQQPDPVVIERLSEESYGLEDINTWEKISGHSKGLPLAGIYKTTEVRYNIKVKIK